jgi:hypothetical protein
MVPGGINPVRLHYELDALMEDRSILVADGETVLVLARPSPDLALLTLLRMGVQEGTLSARQPTYCG